MPIVAKRLLAGETFWQLFGNFLATFQQFALPPPFVYDPIMDFSNPTQHKEYMQRLDEAREGELAVANWKSGLPGVEFCRAFEQRRCPLGGNPAEYMDNQDLEYKEEGKDATTLQVKRRSNNWVGGRGGFPYKWALIDQVSTVDQWQPVPLEVIILNWRMTECAVVAVSTRDVWHKRRVYNHLYKRHERCYLCPSEHVEFFTLSEAT